MINDINTSGDALVLTKNGSAQAVVLSYEKFDSIMETFNIMRDPKTYKELKEAQKSKDYVPFESDSHDSK
jgi:PHD/YefM family antitoxin component YafN of YafNO toxin-antitoxin module